MLSSLHALNAKKKLCSAELPSSLYFLRNEGELSKVQDVLSLNLSSDSFAKRN